MSFHGFDDAQTAKWLWLRAVEWSGFPGYISQVVGPILCIFVPWWQVLIGVFLVGLPWIRVRYLFISPTLSHVAALIVVWFKWPACVGSAIFLFLHHQIIAGIVVLAWPLYAGILTPGGKVGVFQARLASRIGFDLHNENLGPNV